MVEKLSQQYRVRNIIVLLMMVAVSFLLSLWLLFPCELLRQRAQYELSNAVHGNVDVGPLMLNFPPGLSAEYVRAYLGKKSIEIDHVRLSPSWSGLLQATPAIDVSAQLLSGRFNCIVEHDGTYSCNGGGMVVHEKLSSCLRGGSDITIDTAVAAGKITGRDSTLQGLKSLNVQLKRLVFKNLHSFGISAGSFNFGKVTVTMTQQQRGVIKLAVDCHDGDVLINAVGSIKPAFDLWRSVIDIAANIKITANADSDKKALIALLGKQQSNGYRSIHIVGTFLQPRVYK